MTPWGNGQLFRLGLAAVALMMMAGLSLIIGVGELSESREAAWRLLVLSRVPRTIALILAGASMAVSGLLMQMMVRNRFVEPSTAGTVESAGLGMACLTLGAPGLSIWARTLLTALFAMAGTAPFLRILKAVPVRSALIVPLIGIALSGIIHAASAFLAYRYDLLQSLNAWLLGDFSTVLKGRYEILYLSFALTALAYFAADRFTVAGLGPGMSANLGLDYERVLRFGIIIVSAVSATVVTTVGVIPFLGLVVPNLVSLVMGDNARRSIPWIALVGAGLVLVCDIFGRLVNYPFEVPIGTVLGIVGSALFLGLLLKREGVE